MNELVLAGLLGGVGGLTRGVVGLLKALALKGKSGIWNTSLPFVVCPE